MRYRLAAPLTALALLPTLALAAPPTSRGTSVPTSGPTARLRRAIEHYQRSEFDAAERLLLALAREQTRGRAGQETFTYLAFVQAAFGRAEAAVDAFERALAIKPDLQLESLSPKLARLFAQARERYRAKVRALDHDPPRLLHRPPAGKLRYGTAVRISTRVQDISPIKEVTLGYRSAGNRGYARRRMEREHDGSYVASIPMTTVLRPAVEYYIEAWDALGNGPGLKGSTRAPIRLLVEGGPLAAVQGPSRWYQKWWVWAIAAGVVATAAGVSVGAYLAREQTARVTVDGLEELGK